MEKPNYQITANPISAFTTFGEAAPSAPATVDGMPSPPVEKYNAAIRAIGQLSQTVRSFANERAEKQNEYSFQSKQAEVMSKQLEIEELKKAREGNQLTYANLIDNGVITADENPWAKIGAMTALATLNKEMIATNTQTNLSRDFSSDLDLGDGVRLGSSQEPDISSAKYLSTRMNPLGLSEEILNNHYYSVSFEKQFSEVRQRTTRNIVALKLEQDRNNTIAAISAELNNALNGQQFLDMPEGAVDADGNEIVPTETNYVERVETILMNPGYRAALGNKGAVEAAGMYLLEKSKDGDIQALTALTSAKLKNGQTILEASDVINAEFGLAESTINAAMNRNVTFSTAQENRKREEVARNSALMALEKNPNATAAQLLSIIGEEANVVFDPTKPNTLQITQVDRQGNTTTKEMNLSSIRQAANERIFQNNYANSLETLGNEQQAAIAAMEMSLIESNYVHPQFVEVFRQASASFSENMTEEDENKLQAALSLYRQMAAVPKLRDAYIEDEGSRAEMYLLDILERGSFGVLSAFDTENQIDSGSGNIQGLVRRIVRYREQDKALTEAARGNYTESFNKAMKEIGVPLEQQQLVYEVGKLAVGMGIVKTDDMTDFISDLRDNMFDQDMSGDNNYLINKLMTPSVGANSEQYFTGLINFVSNSKKLQPEGTIAREMQDYISAVHGYKVNTPGYKNAVKGFKFTSSVQAQGGIEMQYKTVPVPVRNYSVQDFRSEFNRRLESGKSIKEERNLDIFRESLNNQKNMDSSGGFELDFNGKSPVIEIDGSRAKSGVGE